MALNSRQKKMVLLGSDSRAQEKNKTVIVAYLVCCIFIVINIK